MQRMKRCDNASKRSTRREDSDRPSQTVEPRRDNTSKRALARDRSRIRGGKAVSYLER